MLRIPRGLAGHAVGDEGDAAAALLVQQADAHAQGIEHLHQVLAQLREIVIHIAAVEIGHLLGENRLLLGPALEPALETAGDIGRERPALVHLQEGVQGRFGDGHPRDAVHHGRERTGQRAHEIRGGQDAVPELGLGLVVLDAGRLDEVRHVHAGRAGYLAAFAVEAILERIIEEIRILQAQALTVGAGLLGAGIQRIHLQHRAVRRTDGALHALLEVVLGDGIFLLFHTCSISDSSLRSE